MANDTEITVVGNLTEDPSFNAGSSVANFTVASTPRHFDRDTNSWVDGTALFLRCSAWRELGENVMASLHKGNRVIVQGNLKGNEYQKNGENRYSLQLDVTAIGPELRFATADVTRKQSGGSRNNNGNNGGWNNGNSNQNSAPKQDDNGWGNDSDDAPF